MPANKQYWSIYAVYWVDIILRNKAWNMTSFTQADHHGQARWPKPWTLQCQVALRNETVISGMPADDRASSYLPGPAASFRLHLTDQRHCQYCHHYYGLRTGIDWPRTMSNTHHLLVAIPGTFCVLYNRHNQDHISTNCPATLLYFFLEDIFQVFCMLWCKPICLNVHCFKGLFRHPQTDINEWPH